MLSVFDTLSAISDDRSMVLFNTITLASGDSSIPNRQIESYTQAVLFTNSDLILVTKKRLRPIILLLHLDIVVYKDSSNRDGCPVLPQLKAIDS